MRGADLARAGGISVQQVRNYERAGLLPAAERMPNGYRAFTETHLRALAAVRALVPAHGWRAAVAIMTAVHEGNLRRAVALVDQGHARLDAERQRIEQALGAFESIVTRSPDDDPHMRAAMGLMQRQGGALRIGQLATLLHVRTSALRFWERSDLVHSGRERGTGYRMYDQTAVRDAHLVALLRAGNFPVNVIRAALEEMHSVPDGRADRVGAALDQRNRQLHERSWKRLRAQTVLVGYIEYLGLQLS